MVDPSSSSTHRETQSAWRWRMLGTFHLVVIALVAAGLRLHALDGPSLWFDEVVTMRVARTAGPADLLEQLDLIDGTRAPLYPLILQVWLRVLGSSDWAGRSLSAFCGLGTVVAVYFLGRTAFDEMTGRWAAWLAAVCPPLVYYSQEARMYAWLVLLTCLSWVAFLSLRTAAGPLRSLLYWLSLTALVYSHPLGLFMVAAHGLAFLLVRPYLKLTVGRWLLIEGALVLAIMPWISRYTDHGTDYPMPRQPIRFLAAVPIEYVGGNSIVVVICLGIIAWGMRPCQNRDRPRQLAVSHPAENFTLLCWAAVPPVFMYVYSYVVSADLRAAALSPVCSACVPDLARAWPVTNVCVDSLAAGRDRVRSVSHTPFELPASAQGRLARPGRMARCRRKGETARGYECARDGRGASQRPAVSS